MSQQPDTPSPRGAITLVHGTFARGAEWSAPGSWFCEALQRRLHQPVAFHTFQWSGENSHAARKRAGRELAEHLAHLAREHPERWQAVIAHSHGGNVAGYALEDPACARSVRAIVTLGTPFIRCRARQTGPWTIVLLMVFIDLVGLLTVLGLNIAAFDWLWAWLRPTTDPAMIRLSAAAIFVVTWVSLLIATARTPATIVNWVLRKQIALTRELRLPALRGVRLLAVSVKGDEAGTLLRLLHRLAGVPATVFRRLLGWLSTFDPFEYPDPPERLLDAPGFGQELAHESRIIITLGKLLLYGFWLTITAGVALISWSIVDNWGRPWPAWLWVLSPLVAFVDIAFVAFVILTAMQLLMLTIPPLVRAHRGGYGGESPLHNWLADIEAVDAPARAFPAEAGQCTHLAFPAAELGAVGQPARLRHSRLYQSEAVVQAVARWLNAAIRGGRAPGAAKARPR